MRLFLSAADRLSLSFITLLGSVTILFVPLRFWPRLLGTYIPLALALIGLAFFRKAKKRENFYFYVHLVATVGMILIVFNSMGLLIEGARGRLYDEWLIKADYLLLGVHPTVWLERFVNPALTAVLQFSYISYYFIPISVGIALISKGRRQEFETALFGIVLCFYLSYIGYLLVPAIGPRFTLKNLQTTGLQAGPFITAIQNTLNGMEHNKTDAFPSGHTAVALVSLYYAGKLKEKRLFSILIPVVLALIVSTVYLRYHYVIDVIAGIGLAVVTIRVAPILNRWFSGVPGNSRNERHRSC